MSPTARGWFDELLAGSQAEAVRLIGSVEFPFRRENRPTQNSHPSPLKIVGLRRGVVVKFPRSKVSPGAVRAPTGSGSSPS
jgi:hypothetical protein